MPIRSLSMSDEWTRKQGKDKWDKRKGKPKKRTSDDGTESTKEGERRKPRRNRWSIDGYYNEENDLEYDN